VCVLERKLKTSRPDEDLMYPELSNTVTAEAGPCVQDAGSSVCRVCECQQTTHLPLR